MCEVSVLKVKSGSRFARITVAQCGVRTVAQYVSAGLAFF